MSLNGGGDQILFPSTVVTKKERTGVSWWQGLLGQINVEAHLLDSK
jgi:hypothetical protein